MSAEAERPSDNVITVYNPPSEAVPDGIKDIALRRLGMMTSALGLAPDEFERAHKAAVSALEGAHDMILSDQRREIVGALPKILDPMIRARVTALVVDFASDGSD